MKILIDIYHTPQFNFFKNVILKLSKNEVDLCCVNRGKLVDVIKNDCPGYNLNVFGDYKYNKGKFSMLFLIIIPRLFSLIRLMIKNHYDFVVTAHYMANLAAKILRVPNIAFIDDPRKFVFQIAKYSTNELYLPSFNVNFPDTEAFNALKEWAYLSPSYFEPNSSVLEKFDLAKKEYFFIREVDTKTSNYLGQEEDIILSISKKFPKNLPVVLSLEKKKNALKYPKHWIILNEPVGDIYSLMYFSKLVISSGDSMAREGGMLGVPSIYCGYRDMPANNVLISKGILHKVLPIKVNDFILDELILKSNQIEQEEFRLILFEDWIDVTKLILEKIDFYVN